MQSGAQGELANDRHHSGRVSVDFHGNVHSFRRASTFHQTGHICCDSRQHKKVLDALNSALYGGKVEYELIILPPNEGSFLQVIGVLVSLGGLIVFFDNDSPAAFVEGLTGKKPMEWAKDAGVLARVRLEMLLGGDQKNEGHVAIPYRSTDDLVCKAAAEMLVAMARGSLEMEPDELADLAGEEVEISEVINARADFYDACIFDRQIRAIGFTPEEHFPIPRKSFPERAQRSSKRDVDYEEGTWTSAIDNVTVTSPNWDQDDQESRKWKGKDIFNHTCYFVIEDENFWGLVKSRKLQVRVWDKLKVQWILQEVNGKIKERRVLRVLEVSGAKVSPPMPLPTVIELLEERYATTGSKGNPTLFDDFNGEKD